MQIVQSVCWPLLPLLLGGSEALLFQIPFSFFFSSEMRLNNSCRIVLGQTVSPESLWGSGYMYSLPWMIKVTREWEEKQVLTLCAASLARTMLWIPRQCLGRSDPEAVSCAAAESQDYAPEGYPSACKGLGKSNPNHCFSCLKGVQHIVSKVIYIHVGLFSSYPLRGSSHQQCCCWVQNPIA